MDKILNKKIVEEVLNTKNLKSLNFDFVLLKLEKFFLTNANVYKSLRKSIKDDNLDLIYKNKKFKFVVKSLRDELRVVYSSFLKDNFLKKKSLNNFLENQDFENILKAHKSTFERLPFYPKIYSQIFLFFENIKKVADLGCGFNPFSYFFLKEVLGYDIKYFACDLSFLDMEFINLFFKNYNILGVGKDFDLCNFKVFEDKDFLDSDIVFLFKVIDSLEHVKKNLSKDFLQKIPISNLVVSFPTKSLIAKKNFKANRRNWFFNFLEKMNWTYKTFEVENELFILIKK